MAADNSPDNPKDARNTYLIRVNLLLYKNPTIIYINDATCDIFIRTRPLKKPLKSTPSAKEIDFLYNRLLKTTTTFLDDPLIIKF